MRKVLLIIVVLSLFISTNVFSKEMKVLFYFSADNDYSYDVRKKMDKIFSQRYSSDFISIKTDRSRTVFPDKDVFEDVYKDRNSDFVDVNSGDAERLRDVLNSNDQILWLYSPGYLKNNKAAGFAGNFEPLLFDSTAKDFLDVNELEKIFFKKYRLMIIDHSLFSSIENIYAIRKNFDLVIATQEIIPIKGLPIEGFIKSLKDKEIGSSIDAIFDDVKKKYCAKTNGWWGVPVRYQLSLIDSSSIDRLILHFRFFTKILIDDYNKNSSAILKARKMSVSFNKDYIDIESFLKNIEKVRVSRALKEQAGNLKTILSKVVRRNYYQRPENTRSGGLSVYFPLNGVLPAGYDDCEFSRNTRWNDFLTNLINEEIK